MKEAVQLLKSLCPSGKVLGVKSLASSGGHCRALLDGGATHVLRPTCSKAECDKALPIKVKLTAGITTLRQVETTGTLITDFDTQAIVPLGKIVRLGYRVCWEGESFELWDSAGSKVEVQLESGCPTVEPSLANHLIEQLETHEAEMSRRVAALKAGNPGDFAPTVWKWLRDLRELWSKVRMS